MILREQQVSPEALKRELAAIAGKLNLASMDEALVFPRFVQLETTRLCNAKCPMCLIDKWDKSTPFMADDLFEKIAAELVDHAHRIRWVCIQKAGEPLLDKKIAKRIRRLKDGGIKTVTMSTNASALTGKKGRELLDAGLDELMISFDAVDKETYEKIRVGLNYERVLGNIRTFFRVRDAHRPETRIRVKGVTFHDPDEAKQIMLRERWERFWRDIRKPGDRIYMKAAHNWGNQIEWEGVIPEFSPDVYHPCVMPWSTVQITAMGTICLCPHDFDGVFDLGDVVEKPIAEVWRNAALERVRRLHATGERNQIELCRGCLTYDEEFSLEKDRPTLFPEENAA